MLNDCVSQVFCLMFISLCCRLSSATWPPGVRDLAECYLTDPVQINVGSLDLAVCCGCFASSTLSQFTDISLLFRLFIV